MALLTYEIRGLGDITPDRRQSLRMSSVANNPKLAMAFRQAGEQYIEESQGIFHASASEVPGSGSILGISKRIWPWLLGGLGAAALVGIGVAVFRRRAA